MALAGSKDAEAPPCTRVPSATSTRGSLGTSRSGLQRAMKRRKRRRDGGRRETAPRKRPDRSPTSPRAIPARRTMRIGVGGGGEFPWSLSSSSAGNT